MKILLIEDDETISRFLSEGFKSEGHELKVQVSFNDIKTILKGEDFDIVILDLMLPKVSGFEILTFIKAQSPTLPVIILSAIHSVDNRIKGLELGADDYLTKPFSLHELLARCSAILRRTTQSAQKNELIVAEITMDLARHRVHISKNEVSLAEKEYRLLELMMRNKGEVLSKSRILEEIWNYKFDPQTNIVDVLVCRLRSKLGDFQSSLRIETIRGVGYVFK